VIDHKTQPTVSDGVETPQSTLRKQRVVVRTKDCTTIKGVFQDDVLSRPPGSLPSLPQVLNVHDEAAGTITPVDLTSVKAVFFVRTYDGDSSYEEVKFLREQAPSEIWVKIRLWDEEEIEGRAKNSASLLMDSGFWLWPTDGFANNVLVYVPKSSVREFHVMGFVSSSANQD